MGRGSGTHFDVGDYDVWLLAQTWAPHFCCHHADRCHTVPWAFSARQLSLHGLWPGFKVPRDGQTFPQSCEAAQKLLPNFLPREYIDVAPSFSTCGECWAAMGWLGSCLVVRPSASAQGAATQALQRRHSGALCRAKSIQPW